MDARRHPQSGQGHSSKGCLVQCSFTPPPYKPSTTIGTLSEGPRGGDGLVRRVGLEDLDLQDFDYAYAFHADGTLASAYNQTHLRKAEQDPLLRGRILIPDLALVLKHLKSEPDTWHIHVKAGALYWDWGVVDLAREHFKQAAALDDSGNPYPPFFLGQTEEAQGNFEAAARHYRLAVKREAASPNPSFRASLERVMAKLP